MLMALPPLVWRRYAERRRIKGPVLELRIKKGRVPHCSALLLSFALILEAPYLIFNVAIYSPQPETKHGDQQPEVCSVAVQ